MSEELPAIARLRATRDRMLNKKIDAVNHSLKDIEMILADIDKLLSTEPAQEIIQVSSDSVTLHGGNF